MIEQVGDPRINADVIEIPEFAPQLIAQGTHNELATLVADFVGWCVVVDGENAVEEHQKAYNSRGEQSSGVEP